MNEDIKLHIYNKTKELFTDTKPLQNENNKEEILDV